MAEQRYQPQIWAPERTVRNADGDSFSSYQRTYVKRFDITDSHYVEAGITLDVKLLHVEVRELRHFARVVISANQARELADILREYADRVG